MKRRSAWIACVLRGYNADFFSQLFFNLCVNIQNVVFVTRVGVEFLILTLPMRPIDFLCFSLPFLKRK